MTMLRNKAGIRIGEDSADLCTWVRALADCPPITDVVLATCASPMHGSETASWFYVEADAEHGLARRRCVGCGLTVDLLDSGAHWNFPPMHSCLGCTQSMMEFAVGMHAEPAITDEATAQPGSAIVSWVAVGVRCVTCGRIDGLTDAYVDYRPMSEVLPAI